MYVRIYTYVSAQCYIVKGTVTNFPSHGSPARGAHQYQCLYATILHYVDTLIVHLRSATGSYRGSAIIHSIEFVYQSTHAYTHSLARSLACSFIRCFSCLSTLLCVYACACKCVLVETLVTLFTLLQIVD